MAGDFDQAAVAALKTTASRDRTSKGSHSLRPDRHVAAIAVNIGIGLDRARLIDRRRRGLLKRSAAPGAAADLDASARRGAGYIDDRPLQCNVISGDGDGATLA